MSLTVAYITARRNCRFDWLFQSLARQKGVKRITQIVIVDFYMQESDEWMGSDVDARFFSTQFHADAAGFGKIVTHVAPRPTIWAGPHRITKENWWHASAARNSAIALCENPWIAFLDDRCVLTPGWLPAIKHAMARKYIVAGSYEKHRGLVVKNGAVVSSEEITGRDNREEMAKGRIIKGNGSWLYGCTFALPIEWALKVNGFPEDYCDGISMEDIIFGMCLHNNGYPIRYDPSMLMIEDRTKEECTEVYRREDKGVSPNDKSHKLLEVFANSKTALNSFDLRKIRDDVLAGKPFPSPSASHVDWYDMQAIKGL